MILGLTGGYCAGKSTVARLLEARGWRIVSMDSLGHLALEQALPAVTALLGSSATDADGKPDRKAIGAMVFADPVIMGRYEAIVHPVMNRLAEEAVRSVVPDNVCIDAALLYRLPILEACDAVIEVRAPLIARLRRARTRDGLGVSAAFGRIASQRTLWREGARWHGDRFIVTNAGNPGRLKLAVDAALKRAGMDF